MAPTLGTKRKLENLASSSASSSPQMSPASDTQTKKILRSPQDALNQAPNPKALSPIVGRSTVIQDAQQAFDQGKHKEALKMLETALKVNRAANIDTRELEKIIIEYKNKRLLEILKQAPNFIGSHKIEQFNFLIKSFQESNSLSIEGLSKYIDRQKVLNNEHLYLFALLREIEGEFIQASLCYLLLAENSENSAPALQKAWDLAAQSADPYAYAYFLEKLDRDWLEKLISKIRDPQLEKLLFQKDFIRMVFEASLRNLGRHSPQKEAPTCFICFNIDEADVGKWLEHTLVPDLDQAGIKPLFCFRDLRAGKELNNFQGLIRDADRVIIICTPALKEKCEERKKAPTGVAQEIRLAIERFNDPAKYETTYPIYLKGNRQNSCPSVFFEPILGTQFTGLEKVKEISFFEYYAQAFELMGSMRGVPRELLRSQKEAFLTQIPSLLKEKIDHSRLEKWRKEKAAKLETVIGTAHERVLQKTQLLHLPESPRDFSGRTQELQKLHIACQQNSRVALTGLGGLGKTSLAIKYANVYRSHYQFIHFMPAGTRQQVIEGLYDLADNLRIPQIDKVEDRLLSLKKTLDTFEKYLLIFDGIDQKEAFDELKKYLPQRMGCFLLTTRLLGESTLQGFNLVMLQQFTEEDAVNYLLLVTGSKEADFAKKLAEKLGCLPLALAHAARYMSFATGSNLTIEQYLKDFDNYRLNLFTKPNISLEENEKTILTTWKMSIKAIENLENGPLAKKVLEMFAFLSQAPIPLELVEKWFTHSSEAPNNLLPLRRALTHLCGYSMIDSPYANAYTIHPLVQTVVLYEMPQEKQETTYTTILQTMAGQMEHFDEEKILLLKLNYSHATSLFGMGEIFTQMHKPLYDRFQSSLSKLWSFIEKSMQGK